MHLPYIQVTRETWDYAQQLSGVLAIPFGDAFTAVCELWRWGLSLGPEDQPPTGVCESPRAERLMVAAMRLKGDSAELSAVLVDLGLVERLPSGVRVRGMKRYAAAWEKANKERLRKAAWRESRDKTRDVPRTETGTSRGQDADVTRDVGGKTQTQTQTQIEVPKEKTTLSTFVDPGPADPPQLELVQPEPKRRRSDQAEIVFEHWRTASGHTAAKLSPKRERAVLARLKDGFTPDQLCRAIDGCLATPHNRGENDRGERYDDLELICRDVEHVERFIRNATDPPRPKAKAGRAEVSDWSQPMQEDENGDLVIPVSGM